MWVAVLNLLLLLMMMRWGQLHYTLRMHLEQGGIYVSLADYDAASETEVSLKGRDRVELLKVGCAGWWFVKLLGNDLCILCVINMMYFLSMIWMDVSVDAGCEEISLIMFFSLLQVVIPRKDGHPPHICRQSRGIRIS